MSSILEALKKLEAAEGDTRRLIQLEPPRPQRTGLLLGGLLLAFAAGGGIALVLTRSPAPPAAPTPVDAQVAPPANPVAPAPPATPPRETSVPVADARSAPLAPSPVASPSAAPRLEASSAPFADESPAIALAPTRTPPPPPPAPTLAPEPAGASGNGVLPRPPAGAPRVLVSFLIYSRIPARRSAGLSIDGAGLVTLHEGEEASGLEVARIYPDRVELVHGGRRFVVGTRD